MQAKLHGMFWHSTPLCLWGGWFNELAVSKLDDIPSKFGTFKLRTLGFSSLRRSRDTRSIAACHQMPDQYHFWNLQRMFAFWNMQPMCMVTWVFDNPSGNGKECQNHEPWNVWLVVPVMLLTQCYKACGLMFCVLAWILLPALLAALIATWLPRIHNFPKLQDGTL